MKGIYKITSPTGKVYIGQSIDFDSRFYAYRSLMKRSIGRVLYNSLVKYSFDKHVVEIIHELPIDVDQETLNNYEKIYIAQYKESGFRMMNLTFGGEGSTGYKHTPESIAIMKEKGKGRIAGNKNPNYGKGMHGVNNPMYGKVRPRELIEKLKSINQRPVDQYTLEGTLVASYESATEAGRINGLAGGNISACCGGRNLTYKSFVWKFKGELFTPVLNGNFTPVIKYSLDGTILGEYPSIKEALRSIGKEGKDPSIISAVCNKRKGRTKAYGFIWKYKAQAA